MDHRKCTLFRHTLRNLQFGQHVIHENDRAASVEDSFAERVAVIFVNTGFECAQSVRRILVGNWRENVLERVHPTFFKFHPVKVGDALPLWPTSLTVTMVRRVDRDPHHIDVRPKLLRHRSEPQSIRRDANLLEHIRLFRQFQDIVNLRMEERFAPENNAFCWTQVFLEDVQTCLQHVQRAEPRSQ